MSFTAHAVLAHECERFQRDLLEERNGFVGRHQSGLLEALEKDMIAGVA